MCLYIYGIIFISIIKVVIMDTDEISNGVSICYYKTFVSVCGTSVLKLDMLPRVKEQFIL